MDSQGRVQDLPQIPKGDFTPQSSLCDLASSIGSQAVEGGGKAQESLQGRTSSASCSEALASQVAMSDGQEMWPPL